MNETKPDAPAMGFAEIRRERVFEAIKGERRYQEIKWGDLVDHPQSVGAYLTLMRVHLARAENAWAGANNDMEALDCLRKVLAIGVACGEQHGMPCRPEIDEHTYWKAKALDLEVKRDIAVSTLEKVKVDRTVAQNALAEQCKHTKTIEQQLEAARAEIARLNEQYELATDITSTSIARSLECADQLAAEQAKNVGLREAAQEVRDLIDETYEVYGLRLNGDPSLWDELMAGGRFERLTMLDEALSTPSDTSALEAIVKKAGEVMRDRFRIAEVQGWLDKEFIRALPAVTLEDLK